MTAKGSGCNDCCCSLCGVQLPPEADGCCLCVCDTICVEVRNVEVGGNCDCVEAFALLSWSHSDCAYVGSIVCGSLTIDLNFSVKKCSDGTCRLCLTSECLGLTGLCGNAGCKEFSPGHNGDCGKYLKDCDQSGGWDETWNVDASGCGSSTTCPSIEINVTCYPRVNPAGGGMSRLCKDCDCVCDCVVFDYEESHCTTFDSVYSCWDDAWTATLDLDVPVGECPGGQQTVTVEIERDATTGCCNWKVTISKGLIAEGYPGAGTQIALIKTECPEVDISLGIDIGSGNTALVTIACVDCSVFGGCCPLTLASTDTLIAEVIAVTGGAAACWSVGDTRELKNAAGIWTINGLNHCWSIAPDDTWLGLSLDCPNNDFVLGWDTNSLCGCPETPELFVKDSGQCDPLEFVFTVTLTDDIACPCDDGTITFKITKKP